MSASVVRTHNLVHEGVVVGCRARQSVISGTWTRDKWEKTRGPWGAAAAGEWGGVALGEAGSGL